MKEVRLEPEVNPPPCIQNMIGIFLSSLTFGDQTFKLKQSSLGKPQSWSITNSDSSCIDVVGFINGETGPYIVVLLTPSQASVFSSPQNVLLFHKKYL